VGGKGRGVDIPKQRRKAEKNVGKEKGVSLKDPVKKNDLTKLSKKGKSTGKGTRERGQRMRQKAQLKW